MIFRNLRLTMRQRLRFAEADAGGAMPVNGGESNVHARSNQNLMKKSMLWLVALFIFTSVALKAQSPQKINFQSIVRNTSGVIVSNKSVSFKITILSGSITGTPVFSETHLKTTDAIGLVSLQIGTGTVSSGVFSSIDWGNASHFIKLEADFTGGNTYVTFGTQELMSVPYAIYAAKTDTASLNLTNRLAGKAPVNNPTFTGTVGGITKAMVGLGDVNNTTDVDKPVSSATQAALAAKAPLASPTFTGVVSGIDKTMVGLGNVENTADLSKPVSSATQTALAAKAPLASPTFTGVVSGIDKAMVGLGNVENTRDLSKPVPSVTQTALDTKFNKADFPSGSLANQILYWNGTNWVSLSPGTTGQVLTMSSTGLSWGCLITNTAATPLTTPTLVVNTALTPSITIATTGATGIGAATGLPAGISAAWVSNTITISGTPTASGTFSYSIPLTGGCGTVNATGTITVTDANTVSAASSTPTLCISTALTDITHTTIGATGIGTASGLPAGVTAAWANNTITISGSPSATGTFGYSIPLTGGYGSVSATGTITVTAANTVSAASSTPTLCISTALTNITHTTIGATGIGTVTGLPAGVTAAWASNTITVSGTPTATGTFNYSIPLTGGCGSSVSATGTITVTTANTASAASSTPTLCISTALTPSITHTTTGATGIGTATGLPAGVTAAWAGSTITISGTPTASGTFSYSIPLTGGCGSVSATGTITVTPANIAGTASSTPTLCVSAALTDITHTTTGATGIGTVTGLPAGVTAAWANNTITISGTPTVTGTFSYSIPLTGGCGSASATGTITVTAANTATTASITPSLCISTALTTSITHTTTGATGIGTVTGLPAGVSATWASNTITISGTPTATGTFNYSIPLTGGCGSVSATGTITVTAANTVSAASSTPTLCISTALTDITHTTTEATGIGTATGLPAGVSATWASNTITISGTSTASGTFNYSIPLTGGCGSVSATGTITVTAANTATTASITPSLCISTALTTSITHTTTGATGIGTVTGLPAGVSATWASNTITISGTPTATGTFNYSIPLTGGCGSVSATGTITVTAANTAATPSTTPTLVVNTALTPSITIATTGATGIGTATNLPAGVTAAWASNTITISGTPSATGTFNYSIPSTGGCGTVNATGTMTVIPACPIGKDTIWDIDNNSYNIVAIGTQCWTKQNLRVRKYNNGTAIPFDTSGTTSGNASGQTWGTWIVGAHTIYAHDSTTTTPSNLTNYGYLYNWYAVDDSRGLCPTGWHVPTDKEWSTLTSFVGTTPGTKLKKDDELWSENTGTDDYGFSGLPGGYRNNNGSFGSIRFTAWFWSATDGTSLYAWYRLLSSSLSSVTRVGSGVKSIGGSVRCLRD